MTRPTDLIQVHYRRQPDGAYAFEAPSTGATYLVRRDTEHPEDGWNLTELTDVWAGTASRTADEADAAARDAATERATATPHTFNADNAWGECWTCGELLVAHVAAPDPMDDPDSGWRGRYDAIGGVYPPRPADDDAPDDPRWTWYPDGVMECRTCGHETRDGLCTLADAAHDDLCPMDVTTEPDDQRDPRAPMSDHEAREAGWPATTLLSLASPIVRRTMREMRGWSR